jgi:hypothetical protein
MLDTSSTSTYSLDEVAALAPPSEMKNSPRRLADRLSCGGLSGYHAGRM